MDQLNKIANNIVLSFYSQEKALENLQEIHEEYNILYKTISKFTDNFNNITSQIEELDVSDQDKLKKQTNILIKDIEEIIASSIGVKASFEGIVQGCKKLKMKALG